MGVKHKSADLPKGATVHDTEWNDEHDNDMRGDPLKNLGEPIDDNDAARKIDCVGGCPGDVLLTTFKQETSDPVDVNGVTWKDLLDRSVLTKPVRLCGFAVNVSGLWLGKAKIRITDGVGNKLFPFEDEYVQDRDFVSDVSFLLNFQVVVPAENGYKFQFCSSNVDDGDGNTMTLVHLDVIEVG
jgi:hypothetical protein